MLPLWDTQPHRRPPAFTTLLIAACVVVFGYETWLALQTPSQVEGFITEHALVPARLASGWRTWSQWQTVFSSMFLHGGVAHLAGNCWFLWIFGRSVESRIGSMRYLPLYLVCGVAAAAAQVVFSWGSHDVPMLGASGAISGVLGAYFVLFPTAWVVALVPWVVPVVPIPAVVFLFLWFLFQAWSGVGQLLGLASGGGGGVAWWAHAGGFAAGALIGLALKRNGQVSKARAPS
ncbi:rhomboid family intramembrane serine protease [Opitutaceae bacterium TAV4]|nr:rhomboid family intramembrane serine protease [Opitutaceae bacterium TAV4]RRJ99518.1 rhomboid family intramembrane serine protease [Opitutaceae bacterium TAV3]